MSNIIKSGAEILAAILLTGGAVYAMTPTATETTQSNFLAEVAAAQESSQQLEGTQTELQTEEAPIVEEQATEETQPTEEPTVTWRDNPNNCNTDTHWIAEDPPFNCIRHTADKPKASGQDAPLDIGGTPQEWMLQAGIPQQHWQFVDFIMIKESTWRPGVVNSIGCIGLGQSCPGGSGLINDCPNWATDPVCQLRHFDKYAKNRYGGWPQSYNAWLAQGWW